MFSSRGRVVNVEYNAEEEEQGEGEREIERWEGWRGRQTDGEIDT